MTGAPESAAAKKPGPFDRIDGRWARIGLALLAGALAALAHPPFGFLPGLLGFPLLLILAERSKTVKGAVWMGWLSGFSYFLIGCWWVAEAFLVNPAQAWMAPFAASLLPAGLGLFWAAATGVYRKLHLKGWASGLGRALLFAVLFSIMEWLRGHVLTGFPWNPAGAAWKAGGAGSQFASVAGVYGLGLVTVAAVSTFAVLADDRPRRGRLIAAGLGALMIVALIAGGSWRLSQARVQDGPVAVRIVQADIDQDWKWSPEAYRAIVDRYVGLTARPTTLPDGRVPDVVIWPEGALPASANQVFGPGSPDIPAIDAALEPGQLLLAGLSRAEPAPDTREGVRYFNSVIAIRPMGDGRLWVGALYDKYRLVPFGEFLPLGDLMGAIGVRSLTHMPVDFTHGSRPAPVEVEGVGRFQPLICYEGLYPGFTPGGAGRPEWILNVSNDAWFGATSGPLQHLNLSSYRAIETGLAVVRSTPTGVSAMIDPWGRVIGDQRLGSEEAGVIDAWIPQATGLTLFGQFGDWVYLVLILSLLLFSVLTKRPETRVFG